MDIQSIDPRAASSATGGRDAKSSSGGAFQGVMQMMAEIAANRNETKASDRTDEKRPEPRETSDADDGTVDNKDQPDAPKSETAESEPAASDPAETESAAVAAPATEPAPAEPARAEPETDKSARAPADADAPQPTAADQTPPPAGTSDGHVAAQAAAQGDVTPAADTPEKTSAPTVATAPDAAKKLQTAAGETPPTAAATKPTPVAAPSDAPGDAAPRPATENPVAQAAVKPTPPQEIAALARQAGQSAQAPQQVEQGEATAKASGTAQKSEPGNGRADALMGAKVTVETPTTPVARSQGVSSAVLVQAQQAAANAQPQASTANGGAGTLHVGANQPTFVGADASSANSAAGQNAGGQNAGGQNAGGQNTGGQNAGAQNQGQGGAQSNPQQIGVSFGATIGQRGFGGEASRSQFQEILATRTARAQPASLSGGETPRPLGPGTTSSSTPMTMAGVGGPQSTHTSASSVNRAAATAHGRPGATLGTPADQVAMKLSSTAKDGGGRVTIRLSPEELGKVDIKMEISKDGMVRAVVSVDRQDTLELLQRDAKGLEKALQDAGLQTDGESLEFDLRGDGGQYAGDADEDTGGMKSASDGTTPATDDGDAVANDEQGNDGSGGVGADGSLNLVA